MARLLPLLVLAQQGSREGHRLLGHGQLTDDAPHLRLIRAAGHE